MIKHNTINWLLNPPFLSSTMKLALRSIQKTLTETTTKMMIVLVIQFTKACRVEGETHNKYLYGYINKYDIKIKDKTIKRTNDKQYFLCGDHWSYNFDDVYMFFYTNDDNAQLEQHMITISSLWASKGGPNIQQSTFREPIVI